MISSIKLLCLILILSVVLELSISKQDCDDQGVCFASDDDSNNARRNSRKARSKATKKKNTAATTNCVDKQSNCRQLKDNGQCENDPGNMAINCPRTCKYCHLQTQEVRCNRKFLNLTSTLAYKRGGMSAMFANIPVEFGERYGVQVHSRDPWVVSFDHFLTPKECDDLIRAGRKSTNQWQRSVEFTGQDKSGEAIRTAREARTSSSLWCEGGCYHSPAAKAVSKKIEEVVKIPNVMSQSESFQLLKYEKGQRYGTHHDITPLQKLLACGPRILTFFLYLNDVEEGGETVFTNLKNVSVKPRKGRAVLWPSVFDHDMDEQDMRTSHEARPVIKGKKYAANSWIHLYNFDTSYKWGCCWI